MTEEEKQLLLKDLCGRLPYGVRFAYKENEYDSRHWTLCTLYEPHISKDGTIIDTVIDGWIEFTEYPGAGMSSGSRPLHLEKMLPYLRHMSSMTDEEKKEFDDLITLVEKRCINAYGKGGYTLAFTDLNDWLNAHHFDYRGLIEKGLALEAPKGMYTI